MTPEQQAPISSKSGHIEVITGCMFSGKTEELLKRLRRAEIAGNKVEVVKPSIDDRYSDEEIGSHNGMRREAKVVSPGIGKSDIDYIEAEVVGIDEANFFEESLVDVVEHLAEQNKRVIISGLDLNYRGEPFSPVPQLIAKAEYIDKLKAVCVKCGKPATKTQRLVEGEPAHVNDPTILVGAEESYEARCRNCHALKQD